MRPYPRNSPQAAARILAITLLADGHVSQLEMDVLDHVQAHVQLGMQREELHDVIHGVCEDMLAMSGLCWGDTCKVDPHTLGQLLQDIDDPTLRQKLLYLCVSVIEADTHVTEAESSMLATVMSHWHGYQADPHPLSGPYHPAPTHWH